MKIPILIISILILLSELVLANSNKADKVKTVPTCENHQEMFSTQNVGVLVKNIESLPKLVYVAKRARYYIESKKHNFQLAAAQSFLKGEAKILCSTLSEITEKSFSLYAPALIDMTESKKTGNSFWQFHISVKKAQLGIWNQKSRMFNQASDIEKALASNGLQLQIQQISHDEFEMIFSRENGDYSERLLIRYDATKDPR